MKLIFLVAALAAALAVASAQGHSPSPLQGSCNKGRGCTKNGGLDVCVTPLRIFFLILLRFRHRSRLSKAGQQIFLPMQRWLHNE
jgi:hypothetical protein